MSSTGATVGSYSYLSSYTTPSSGHFSAGETSSDSTPSVRLKRGSGSHSPFFPASLPRRHRYNPIATPGCTDIRRETIRRQRIESEQRRRDELREGYGFLKDVLPVSNQKPSKVSLLDRAVTHIKRMEIATSQLQTRLQQVEDEVQRLRTVNEALILNAAEP
ncbi:hypothetical protein HWV62_26560 [Athelia sp. TMB]|nr:hypothetical protein HWV62_26560 [Athelia sp. TMB]